MRLTGKLLIPGMGRNGWLTGVCVIAAAIFLLAPSAAALGAEEALTRDEYVNRLEAMCKPRAEATQVAMKGVRKDVRYPDRLRIAVGKFAKGAKIFGGTIDKIFEVPQPAADVGRLKEWFTYLNRQEQYLLEITDQLRMSHTIRAQRLTSRFIHNGNLANNVTLAFGFDFCSFKFSRYGF
jgi:hypothetical protein